MANPNFDPSGSSASRSSTSGSPAGANVADSYDAIKSDISNLTDQVKKMATERVGAAVGDAQDQVKQKLGDVESMIRKSPTQAALIAAGVGFLVGLVLSR